MHGTAHAQLRQRPGPTPGHRALSGRPPSAGRGHLQPTPARNPNDAEALNLLGAIAHQVGKFDIAADFLRRAVAANPSAAPYYTNLAEVLRSAGRFDEAIAAAQRAAQITPANPQAHFTIGLCHLQVGRVHDAVAFYQEALRLDPRYASAHINLGAAYEKLDRLDDAVASYRRAIAIDPRQSNAHGNLGVAYARMGRLDEAIASYRQAIALDPANVSAHSDLIYTLLHHPAYDAPAIFREHLAWARRHAEPLTAAAPPHTNTRDPHRRLRIGYVSPNFRSQAVSYFMEPILAHHDHQHFEIFCYHDAPNADHVTAHCRAAADAWRDIAHLTHDQLAQLIRQDQIDILLDLNGHIPHHRLLTFARKPAPIQITYIGYQTTTGMSAMDYRITDAVADPNEPPAGPTDPFHTEKLLRLPLFFCYQPLNPSPPPAAAPPADSNGFITFGSMNNFVKIGPQVIAVWAGLLKKVPTARLLILIAGGNQGNAHVPAAFASHGIDPARLQLVPMRPVFDYLDLFNRIDISLDPFPFSGHTTTCDALWMGVPVVTRAGSMYAGRMATSVLSCMNLHEWIATSAAEYIDIAARLAGDLPRLRDLRVSLRQRFADSPAMDAAGFTRHLKSAYRYVWRQWCDDSPGTHQPMTKKPMHPTPPVVPEE